MEIGGTTMVNSFGIALDPPYTFNFLIYIQNIYLNQKNTEEDYFYKHPYIPSKISFKKDFELQFNDLFDEISHRIMKNDHDLVIFYEENELIYNRLFEQTPESFNKYNDIYKAFQVWWRSTAGQSSIEMHVYERTNSLYEALSTYLKKKKIIPSKGLKINLIFDKCILSNSNFHPYFATVSIEEIIFYQEELASNLKGCLS